MRGVLIEVAHRSESEPAIVPDARITELPELPAALSRMEISIGKSNRGLSNQ
jgi:hypothetical protein